MSFSLGWVNGAKNPGPLVVEDKPQEHYSRVYLKATRRETWYLSRYSRSYTPCQVHQLSRTISGCVDFLFLSLRPFNDASKEPRPLASLMWVIRVCEFPSQHIYRSTTRKIDFLVDFFLLSTLIFRDRATNQRVFNKKFCGQQFSLRFPSALIFLYNAM